MEINVPGILEAAVPKTKDGKTRNVGIISNNMNGINHNDPKFLSDDFPKNPPRIYITSEDDEFDIQTITDWKSEGFNVEYVPMGAGGKEYKLKLDGLRKVGLGPCETFGVVAFGEAAAVCLEHFHVLDNNPDFKLSLLVAYYPTRIPDPNFRFPGGVEVLVHLAGDSVGIVKRSQMVGIQGKKRVSRRRLDSGLGVGGTVKMAWPAFSYDSNPGFAERDLDEFDGVHADLAWSRSLGAARRAFRWDVDLQGIAEENANAKWHTGDTNALMKTFNVAVDPHVTYMPTLTGGVGPEELEKFYGDFFTPCHPDSLQLTLISRTSAADRVVDELHVSFRHTCDMPWILPGIAPTNRKVEIMIVSIVTLRGGKLAHERVYWDQASVLVQTGLLDPRLVSQRGKKLGVERLPVVGKQPARRVIEGGYDDVDGEADNNLIPEFWDDFDGGEDDEGEDDEDDEDEDGEEYDEEDEEEDEEDEDDEEEAEEEEEDDDIYGVEDEEEPRGRPPPEPKDDRTAPVKPAQNAVNGTKSEKAEKPKVNGVDKKGKAKREAKAPVPSSNQASVEDSVEG